MLVARSFAGGKIGGQDVIVEIDESKFRKRECIRSHHVEGTLVFGGLERLYDEKGSGAGLQGGNFATFVATICGPGVDHFQ
jgi:hypothetical protein